MKFLNLNSNQKRGDIRMNKQESKYFNTASLFDNALIILSVSIWPKSIKLYLFGCID